jgi:antitoxin component of RelBE/YafQ-DinJ toxin-antitoxin module
MSYTVAERSFVASGLIVSTAKNCLYSLTSIIPLYILWYMKTTDKSIINIKVNKTLKHEAQDLADEIGVPLTTVITASLKEFVRSRSLTVSAFPRLKPEIERELGEAIADYKKGKNISKTLSKPSDVANYLSAL